MSRVALALLLVIGLPSAARAQGVRGTAVSTARVIQMRALVTDTVDAALAGDSLPCRAGPRCVFLRAGPVQETATFTQDVRLTAWGFGVTGLSATAYLRARAHAGDAAPWPRSDDAFDAMLAYAEYDREPVRVRLGRQTSLGGLGFASYDGVSALFRRGPSFSAEAFVGRSLARGLSEPRSEALRGFDALVTDPSVVLFGGVVSGEPLQGITLGGRYQREIFADRAGLASERASADLGVTRFAPLRLTASADWDFAFGHLGKAEVRGSLPLPAGFRLDVEGHRYVPYFELWTIWGFFDPVAWHEAAARVWWRSGDGSVHLRLGGALRRYGETNTDIFGEPLERDSRRIEAGAAWQAAPAWRVEAGARRETGFGASSGGGDLSVRWSPGRASWLRGFVTAFNQVEEFRTGRGTVLGSGVAGGMPVGPITLEGGLSLYDHGSDRAAMPDWTQRRAWLGLRLDFGRDPGLREGSR